jgi:hypothetical protein
VVAVTLDLHVIIGGLAVAALLALPMGLTLQASLDRRHAPRHRAVPAPAMA